ncbi:unnamed protein product [Phaedon cochleariae]|uniref:Uncharacterized protein n=1 Tax=Phaedon cochleariae TaxID=80249 RepID=A0A9P0DQ90_PHACE|nr:unnamed protein product [Phaedon cochleariae]
MSQAMVSSVEFLLKTWSLDHLVQIFEEQGIDEEAFNYLTEEVIKDLIPKIGDRIKFTRHYQAFQATEQASRQPVLFDISNISSLLRESDVEEGTPSTSSCSTSVGGIEYEDFLQDKQLETIHIPPKPQNALCVEETLDKPSDKPESLTCDFVSIFNLMCTYVQENCIPTSRFVQLARSIKQLFPTENIATYYSPYQTDSSGRVRKCARGKLYDKYHNLRRNLRSTGILKSKKTKQRDLDHENRTEVTEDKQQEQEELIQWLQNCIEPWTDVIAKWEMTFESRQAILKSDIDAQAYFDKFLALKQPLGYTLIELDFKKNYKEYENKLFYHLPELLELIRDYAKGSRDPTVKQLLEENETCENDEQMHALGLLILPYLFAKTQLIAPKQKQDKEDNSKKNKRVQWRPSRAEVQESFIVHLKSATELQPFLERRNSKYANLQQSCQPVIILVGSNLTKLEPIINFNNLKFSVGNLLKTVDVAFKLFHVINLKYPVECDHVWMFIQKYVYEISTPYDTTHVVVEQLYSDLLQQKEN